MHLSFQCNQKWERMQDTAGGKLCTRCNKTVFDLRNKSREEILKQYRANHNQLCGYAREEQMDEEPAPAPFNLRVFLAGLATVFSLSVSRSFAQIQTPQTEQHPADFAVPETGQPETQKVSPPPLDIREAESEPRVKHRRYSITLFRVGNRRVFLSRRFPFLHVRRHRLVAGMFAF